MNTWAVIPTYNERDNAPALASRLFATVPGIRILIVDDNSPDGTAEAVRALQSEMPRLELLLRTTERGFGSAYVAGFRRVLSDPLTEAVLMMDADLSHDPAHIPAMLAKIETCDAVIGSRYVPGGSAEGLDFSRRMLSRFGNAYVRSVTGMPFHDCSSGFNLIEAGALRSLDLSAIATRGYAFIMELKYLLWRSGAKIEEVPIGFRKRIHGESKISGRIIREGLRAPWTVRLRRA